MRNMPNIEKSAFRPGEYVGYAEGRVYHIRRNSSNRKLWDANLQNGIARNEFEQFYICKTLAQLKAIFQKL